MGVPTLNHPTVNHATVNHWVVTGYTRGLDCLLQLTR